MCSFRNSEGVQCARNNIASTDYCSLHFGWDVGSDDLLPDNPSFNAAFGDVLAERNGDWRGFVFPPGSTLPNEVDFAVDARGCQFSAVDLGPTTFKEPADFSGSLFRKSLALRGTKFERSVTFDRCRFLGPVDFLNVQCKQSASFHRAEFSDRTILRINFAGSANLNEVVFRDAVTFAGWRNVSAIVNAGMLSFSGQVTGLAVGGQEPNFLQRLASWAVVLRDRSKVSLRQAKLRWTKALERVRGYLTAFRRRFTVRDPNTQLFPVFEREGQLQNVIFTKPEQTSFSQVDLSNVLLSGTNMRGVRFLGVNWWQPRLGRNGLRDEVFIRFSRDGPFRHRELPALEETCRNVRVAFEESRSFNIASDFYIAEMEASRAQLSLLKRNLFSIAALYRAVSNYGTSVATAVRVLALLFAIHILATIVIADSTHFQNPMSAISAATLRSLNLIVFQASHFDSIWRTEAQAWIDALFRIFGLIQIAMLAFAFRARIKRQ